MTSPITLNVQKNENYVIIASLKSEIMGKLINRIPGSCLLILSLLGSALIMHVESLGKLHDVNKRSQSLVLLISKDTHLVFSMSMQCIKTKTTFPQTELLDIH